MTPAESRRYIVELKEAVKAIEVRLEHFRDGQSDDHEAFRSIESRLAEFDKRVSFLEREAADRKGGTAETRAARRALWAAMLSAIIGAVGAILGAFVAHRK